MKDADFARQFTALMDCRGLALSVQILARELAGELKDRKRLLDVGGGSGIYAVALVAATGQSESRGPGEISRRQDHGRKSRGKKDGRQNRCDGGRYV